MESVSVLQLPVAPFMRVYHILDDRFDALWPAQVQPDGSLPGLEDQGKGEKGAALSFFSNE